MAALTWSQTGTASRFSYADMLDITFDELVASNDKPHVQGEVFFTTVKANRMEHKMGIIGSILDIPTKSEDDSEMPYVQVAPSYNKTFTLVNYRSAVKITKTLMETDQHDVAKDILGGLFKSYQRHLEYQYVDIFNTAFTTTGADGANLFADSHTHADAIAGTWDNLNVASDITNDSYASMRLNMRNRTDEKGNINPMKLDKLVCVADKERRAKEVIGSAKTADTNLNNEWAFHNEVDIMVWDSLTSSTAWFGYDSSRPAKELGLYKVERVAPSIEDIKDDPSVGHDIIFARRLRFSNVCGATIMYGWDGNAGA